MPLGRLCSFNSRWCSGTSPEVQSSARHVTAPKRLCGNVFAKRRTLFIDRCFTHSTRKKSLPHIRPSRSPLLLPTGGASHPCCATKSAFESRFKRHNRPCHAPGPYSRPVSRLVLPTNAHAHGDSMFRQGLRRRHDHAAAAEPGLASLAGAGIDRSLRPRQRRLL